MRGGGGEEGVTFPTCTIVFLNVFACVDNFFLNNPLLDFSPQKNNVGQRGGGGDLEGGKHQRCQVRDFIPRSRDFLKRLRFFFYF